MFLCQIKNLYFLHISAVPSSITSIFARVECSICNYFMTLCIDTYFHSSHCFFVVFSIFKGSTSTLFFSILFIFSTLFSSTLFILLIFY